MPVIWTALWFSAGILTASFFDWRLMVWWLPVGFGLLFLLLRFVRCTLNGKVAFRAGPLLRVVAFLGVFALGAARYRAVLPVPGDPDRILNAAGTSGQIVVIGLVDSDPVRDDHGLRFEMEPQEIRQPGQVSRKQVSGRVMVRAPAGEEVHFGDRVVVRGRLERPEQGSSVSYREYLAHRNIFTMLSASRVGVLESGAAHPVRARIYRWREKALDVVYQLWADPEASLLAGILLGVESRISEPVQEAFRQTGTTHIIAISGFNITIVAGLISSLLSRALRPWAAVLGSIFGITIFTLLVGADPAVVRAALMGGSSLIAHQIGRRQHGLNALALAGLVMTVLNPQILWEISFQLSVSATLGLVLYADPLQGRLEKVLLRWIPAQSVGKVSRPLSEYVLFTLAAQATTLPLLVYHFHQVSLSSLLVNPLILPLQPGVMILGGIALILGVIWLPLGRLAAPLAYPLIFLTIRVVELFSRLPGGVIDLPAAGMTFVMIWYGALLLLSLPVRDLVALPIKPAPAALYGVLCAAALLAWQSYYRAPDGRVHLYFLSVGTGTAVLIQGPEGERVLFNGGPSASRLAEQLGRILPPFSRDLDLLVVSSPLEGEITGTVDVIDRYPPAQVWWVGGPSPSRSADRLRAQLKRERIPIQEGDRGSRAAVGREIRLSVLTETTRGGSILVEYGAFSALLPGGLDPDDGVGPESSGWSGPVAVYLLADHGRLESNPQDWIADLNPQLCVLTISAEDRDGLPDPALLGQLGGYSLLRTDLNGTIAITTDGRRMWINVERLE